MNSHYVKLDKIEKQESRSHIDTRKPKEDKLPSYRTLDKPDEEVSKPEEPMRTLKKPISSTKMLPPLSVMEYVKKGFEECDEGEKYEQTSFTY